MHLLECWVTVLFFYFISVDKDKKIKNPKHHTISGINISQDTSSSIISTDVSALSLHDVDFDEELKEYEESKGKAKTNSKSDNKSQLKENKVTISTKPAESTITAIVPSPVKINNENTTKEIGDSTSLSINTPSTNTNTNTNTSTLLSKSIAKKCPLLEKEILKNEELKQLKNEIKNELIDFSELELYSILLEKEIQKISYLFNGTMEINENISLPSNSTTELIQKLMNSCLYLSDYVLKIKEELDEEKSKNNELKNELEQCIKDNLIIRNEWKEYKNNIDEKINILFEMKNNENMNKIKEIKTCNISPNYQTVSSNGAITSITTTPNTLNTTNISSISSSPYIENISVSNEYSSPSNVIPSSPPQFTPPTSLLLPKKYDLYNFEKHMHHYDNSSIINEFINNDNNSFDLNEKRVRFKDPIESFSPMINKNLINSFNENENDENEINRKEIQKNMIMKEKSIDLKDDDFEPCFLE